MLAQSIPTSSDSYSTSSPSPSDFSPDIITQTPPTLQHQQPLACSGPGATRRLSYKIATDLQQRLSAAYNRTPSIHPESSTPNGFSVESQQCEILTEVKKTNERISQYDGRLKAMEQKLINLEQSTTSCSSDEFSHLLKRKVPAHVRQLVRDLYRSLQEEDESFAGFDVKKKYSEKHNQDIMKKLLVEAKGQDATLSHLHIKDAVRRFFVSKSEELSLKANGKYDIKVKKLRRRNRIMKKLESRKSTLAKTSAIPEDKKAKWRELLVQSFMSSEESGEDGEGDTARPVLYVKTLPWRSSHVTNLFQQLDHKTLKHKSKRAKFQTLPRIPGHRSSRLKPICEFGAKYWGFAD